MQVSDELKARFNEKWQKVESGCWEWTASLAGKGYGQIKIPGTRRQIYAHRLSWLIHKGPIPEHRQLCHTCDNPKCVNPEHLFVGTSSDNHLDMKAKGRHLYGEKNGNAKLTEAEARKVKELEGSLSYAQIAKLFDISPITVLRIIHGTRWGHLD